MRLFITGGSGFIGRNLKEAFEGEHEVSAPAHSELDLLDEHAVAEYLRAGRFDVVLHCATENATVNAKRDRSLVLHHNCRMFFNLARCSDRYGRMIYFGSGAEYDARHYKPLMREEDFDRHVPVQDYGFSKYVIAKYAERTGNIYNLRLFGVFGPYEDWEIRFISNACVRAAWDLPIRIRQNVFFDYLWIGDLVPVVQWFLRSEPRHNTYNVCTGAAIDLRSLAATVLQVSGKNLAIETAHDGLGVEYSGSNSRLRKEFENLSFTPSEQTIRQLYRWYEDRRECFAVERAAATH